MRKVINSLAAHFSTDERGLAAIEFAIIMPVLVLMAVCTADFGLAIYADMQVQNAAQAGTDYALLHGYNSTAMANAVTGSTNYSAISASPAPSQICGCAGSGGITAATCGSICPNGNGAGTYVTASATATYSTIIDYPIVPRTFTFTAQSMARIK